MTANQIHAAVRSNDMGIFMDLATLVARVARPAARRAALRGLEVRMTRAGLSHSDMRTIANFYKQVRANLRPA